MTWTKFAAGAVLAAASVALFIFGDGGKEMLVAASNLSGAAVQERIYGEEAPRRVKGEEWGRFEFGSTLVVVAAPGVAALEGHESGASVRMGARIGALQREYEST